MNLFLLNNTQDPVLQLQENGECVLTGTEEAHNTVDGVALLIGTDCQVLNAPMPIKQARQIVKALPFAMEEQLANDLDQNHLVYLGRTDGKAYAATIGHHAMQQISTQHELKKLFFLPLLLPINENSGCIFITNGQACVRIDEFSAFSAPVELLSLTLERSLGDSHTDRAFNICFAQEPDDLLQVQLESLGLQIHKQDFPSLFSHILNEIKSSKNNLLSGPYQVKVKKQNSSLSKFKPLMSLAACLFVILIAGNWFVSSQQNNLADMVKNASKQYYQTLFPGERARAGLRRQFRDKLETASPISQSSNGFTDILAKTTSHIRKNKDAQLQSVRFTSKKGVLEVSLLTNNIAQLDSIKQALEKNNLHVEIASANNDGKKIKGLLKVSNNG